MSKRISAIVLAAGMSKRFGPENKLLVEWRGKPIIRHVAETVLAAGPDEVIVVTGHEADRIEAALSGLPVRFAFNARYQEGMGTSIACGVRVASPDSGGFLIVLGDMPLITSRTVLNLHQALSTGAKRIVAPFHGDRQGNPVLFAAAYREELQALAGGHGARSVIEPHRECLIRITVSTAELEDLDEPKA